MPEKSIMYSTQAKKLLFVKQSFQRTDVDLSNFLEVTDELISQWLNDGLPIPPHKEIRIYILVNYAKKLGKKAKYESLSDITKHIAEEEDRLLNEYLIIKEPTC